MVDQFVDRGLGGDPVRQSCLHEHLDELRSGSPALTDTDDPFVEITDQARSTIADDHHAARCHRPDADVG